MSYTFGSSDASDFELPDPDAYIFQVTAINPPEIRPNSFFDQWVAEYNEKQQVKATKLGQSFAPYDVDRDPLHKKEESNVVIECTVFKSVSGDDEWTGTMVKFYSSSKACNEMGNPEYPTKLRILANAVLGRTASAKNLLERGETVDADQILNGYFQGTYVHKEKKAGGIRGQIEATSIIPYKAQGTGQGGRRRNAPPPPPPPVEEEFDADAEFGDEELAS